MVRASHSEMPPPQYLDQVERAIGVRLCAQETTETLIQTAPGQLEPQQFAMYYPIYVSGLRLLAAARRQFDLPHDTPLELTSEQRRALRSRQSDAVERLRDRVSAAAPIIPTTELRDTITRSRLQSELGVSRMMLDNTMDVNGMLYVTFRRSRKSKFGMLQVRGEDAARLRELAAAIQIADENDVQFTPLMRELGTNSARLHQAMATLGIVATEKRVAAKGRLAGYVTLSQAEALRAHFFNKKN